MKTKILRWLKSPWTDALPIVLGGLIFGFELWQLSGILIVSCVFIVIKYRYLLK